MIKFLRLTGDERRIFAAQKRDCGRALRQIAHSIDQVELAVDGFPLFATSGERGVERRGVDPSRRDTVDANPALRHVQGHALG